MISTATTKFLVAATIATLFCVVAIMLAGSAISAGTAVS